MATSIANLTADTTAITVINFPFGSLRITDRVTARLAELGYTPEELAEAVGIHTGNNGTTGALYVGTYHKYNCGSLYGAWVNLDDFDSHDDFINFCMAIHADENDPELMFQDYEGFPEAYYSESGMSESDFKSIKLYIELAGEYGNEALEDFFEISDDLNRFRDAYQGKWASEEAYAEYIVSELYDLDKIMGNLACYFDYSAFARDLFMTEHHFGSNGTVFTNY